MPNTGGVIMNDVSNYINLLVRIAHIIFIHPLECSKLSASAPLVLIKHSVIVNQWHLFQIGSLKQTS